MESLIKWLLGAGRPYSQSKSIFTPSFAGGLSGEGVSREILDFIE